MSLAFREKEGKEILRRLYEESSCPIAMDTETTGLNVKDGRDTCIGISIAAVLETGEAVSHYFPTGHPNGDCVDDETLQMLNYVLAVQERPLIFANVQFDLASMLTIDIDARHQEFYDILTIANLVDENRPFKKSLDQLFLHYYGETGKAETKRIKQEKETGWPTTSAEEMWEYAVTDAVSTYRLWIALMNQKGWEELPDEVWADKQKVIRILLEMSLRGVKIDVPMAASMEKIGRAKIASLKEELKFNPASHKDMNRIFIEELKLPVIKRSQKTKKPSFDSEAMDEYDTLLERLDSPLGRLVREFRGWQKATTACYAPYVMRVSPDGRLRCDYNTHRTVSGRLSSSSPNLQQIPKETDKVWNGKVKECFIAEEGYTLVEFDYAQLELRLAAAYSQEPHLLEIFEEGRDLFTEMAERLGLDRQDVKRFVYATNYGAGVRKIARSLGVSEKRAHEIVENYKATYPKLANLDANCQGMVRGTGEVRMWNGRKRRFPFRSQAYKAMNALIQGGGADVVENRMIEAWETIDCPDARMLMQVHDSLVWEIKTERVDEFVPRIVELMENVQPDEIREAVRFKVEASIRQPEMREAA